MADPHANSGAWKIGADGAVSVDGRDNSGGSNPRCWIKDESDGRWKREQVDDAKSVLRLGPIVGNQYVRRAPGGVGPNVVDRGDRRRDRCCPISGKS